MEIRYELNRNDLEAASAHIKARKHPYTSRFWISIGTWLIIWLIASSAFPHLGAIAGGPNRQWIWWLTAGAVFGPVLWMPTWRRSAAAARWLEQFTGSCTLALTSAGLSSGAPGGRVGFRPWPEIIAFETTEAYLYMYLRSDAAITVPRSELGDRAEAFADEVRSLWAAHPYNAGKVLPALPPAPGAGAMRALWANIRGGARVAFMRNFDSHRFEVSGYHLWRLYFALLVCSGIFDYVGALPAPAFNIYGLTAFATTTLLAVVAAASISGLHFQRTTTLRLLVMIASVALVINLVFLPPLSVLEHVFPASPWVYRVAYAVPALWLLLGVFRISGHLYRLPWPGASSCAGIFALFTLALGSFLPDHRLFYNDDPDEEGTAYYKEAQKLNAEDVFYRQAELVQNALAHLAPQRPGKTDIYFVGFAGDGREKVFANEVRFARGLLERRFDAAGRSLVLLNSPEAAEDTPLANPHNLDSVLKGIAAKMDKKEDVLFLFLSSHGGRDHRLAVSQWPLQLNDLKAEEIKAMLDRYGIRNRVIVVSACYSGGFIDVLKGDNTLVLTSSSRDHVSYGCGDHTEFTWFGDSYFVQALAHGDSFITAFDDARRRIEEREKKEGNDPSRPQIDVGRNIPAILQRITVTPVDEPLPLKELQANFTAAFGDRVRKAHMLESQPRVQDYLKRTMSPAVGSAISASMEKCLSQSAASSASFNLVADIGPGGTLTNIEYTPQTNTAKCFAASLRTLHFPLPPREYLPLPVLFDMEVGG